MSNEGLLNELADCFIVTRGGDVMWAYRDDLYLSEIISKEALEALKVYLTFGSA